MGRQAFSRAGLPVSTIHRCSSPLSDIFLPFKSELSPEKRYTGAPTLFGTSAIQSRTGPAKRSSLTRRVSTLLFFPTFFPFFFFVFFFLLDRRSVAGAKSSDKKGKIEFLRSLRCRLSSMYRFHALLRDTRRMKLEGRFLFLKVRKVNSL